MSREALVRFCERARLKCLARLTYVEGRLRIREYELKDNGGKRQRAEIIASRVQFLGIRPADAKSTEEVHVDLTSDDAPF